MGVVAPRLGALERLKQAFAGVGGLVHIAMIVVLMITADGDDADVYDDGDVGGGGGGGGGALEDAARFKAAGTLTLCYWRALDCHYQTQRMPWQCMAWVAACNRAQGWHACRGACVERDMQPFRANNQHHFHSHPPGHLPVAYASERREVAAVGIGKNGRLMEGRLALWPLSDI